MSQFSDLFENLLGKDAKEELGRSIKDLGDKLNVVLNKTGEGGSGMHQHSKNTTTAPLVNIVETGDSFRLEVAAPGFTKENFKISVDNGAIIVKGQKEETTTQKSEKYLRTEFSYTTFERSFNLPDTIDVGKISAACTNGVLCITLGKKDEAIVKSGVEINIQ